MNHQRVTLIASAVALLAASALLVADSAPDDCAEDSWDSDYQVTCDCLGEPPATGRVHLETSGVTFHGDGRVGMLQVSAVHAGLVDRGSCHDDGDETLDHASRPEVEFTQVAAGDGADAGGSADAAGSPDGGAADAAAPRFLCTGWGEDGSTTLAGGTLLHCEQLNAATGQPVTCQATFTPVIGQAPLAR